MSDRLALYRRAIEKLGFRQKAYQQAFGVEGSPAYLALLDAADFSGAFKDDSVANLTDAQLREMHGRRQLFFRIWKNLNLTPAEMQVIARGALLRAAERLAQIEQQGDE